MSIDQMWTDPDDLLRRALANMTIKMRGTHRGF